MKTLALLCRPLFGCAVSVGILAAHVGADETCQSPYMPRITGQEEFVYVWTLGVEGVGDGSDKLVTIDVKPGSDTFGKMIHTVSVGGRHEAHHGGFTDDRRQLWLSGLDSSSIFIFDVASDAAKPKLVNAIRDFAERTGGAVGPHGIYALPGRVLIPCLSNSKDKGGRTAFVELSNSGKHLGTHWMPTEQDPRGATIEKIADGYGYDLRVLPRKNVMLSSSFTGHANYMRDFGSLVQDADAMKQMGQTMVLWDLHTRQPKKVFHVPGAPLEVRWAWRPTNNFAFTATALTSKLWLVFEDKNGEWKASEVAHVGGEAGALPVDISISSDDKTLFVDCFADGKCRVFDISNPHKPKQIHETTIGRQVNMVSQSWDGRRLYFTSSLLANWDKKGDDNEQYLKAFTWNGKQLEPVFAIDFAKEKLGRPHMMTFGSSQLYN